VESPRQALAELSTGDGHDEEQNYPEMRERDDGQVEELEGKKICRAIAQLIFQRGYQADGYWNRAME
jgi:hypothetical protein